MYRVDQTIIQKKTHAELYAFCDDTTRKANSLRNAVRFRQRQIFCGWDKQTRTPNEKEVFLEVDILKDARPSQIVKKNISYRAMDALLRENNNPDYFSGLPMQSAQQIVKDAINDFKNWFASLKKYKRDPSGYTAKPRMPGYCRSGGHHSYVITNQDAVLYPVVNTTTGEFLGMELKLPLIKYRLPLNHLQFGTNLKEVEIIPYYDAFIVSLTLELPDDDVTKSYKPNLAAVDFGADNIAAIVSTDAHCAVFKGGAILSNNQLFAKRKASAVSIITKGHEKMKAESNKLSRMSREHSNFNRDQMHKISRAIVSYCQEHKVGTLILGVNKQMKQKIDIGKTNNQNFVAIPFYKLRAMITYKAQDAGIRVVEQEESYTSKADITQQDKMPVYGDKDANTYRFSGKRVQRGMYRTKDGMLINADCNGAANILRKAIPDAWDNCTDYHFLSTPISYNFVKLDLGYKPTA